MQDAELLRDYVTSGSDTAFAELVDRYVDFVFSTARRQLGNAQLAEEVAQVVFSLLARKAVGLVDLPSLAGWLYRATCFTAAKTLRTERRRRHHEQEAATMNQDNATEDEIWERLSPMLDDALKQLEEQDRLAVLLRFFQKKPMREVGETLGVSEAAAKMRVSRAVERLREFFSKRGVAVGASGLATVLSANAVQAAPIGLSAAISTGAALAGTAVSTSTAIAATRTIAMTTLQKTIAGATLVVAVGTAIYEAHRASTFQAKVETLEQQQAPLAGQTQQLRRERDDATNKLAALQQENQQLRRGTGELAKLRGEVARLRPLQEDVVSLQKIAAQSTSSLAEWKLDQVMNVGRATPQDALQSSLWAETTTNLSEIKQSLIADKSDPPTEADMDRFVDDPHNHLHFNKEELQTGKIKVLSQKIVSSDEAVLTVSRQWDQSGKGIAVPLTLRNVNGEWKIVVFNVRDAEGKVTNLNVFGTRPPSP